MSKEDSGNSKSHRRSSTLDSYAIKYDCVQAQQSNINSTSPSPPPPLPALPGNAKTQPLTSAPSKAQVSGEDAPHLRGRRQNGIGQDQYEYAHTDSFSSSVRSNGRSLSPGKLSRAPGSMSTLATSLHPTTQGSAEYRSTNGSRACDPRSPSPSRSYHRILEDPDMTDASSSVYSMEELIKAIPQIHPLYVKRIAGMGSPGKSPDSFDKKPSPPKKGRFLDTFKRMAKEVADATDIKVSRRAKDSERGKRSPARVRISLGPREQSLLYCELEFILTSALDGYINSQFNAGRLDADKYKKVVDAWHQKGRPKVIGFRYDLETQLDLVFLHVQEFRFYGNRAGNFAAISGILEMMRVNARALRIRTFCQPDSVVAKQLLDSQSLLDLLGSAEQRQVQLAEIVQFFKIVLEREDNLHRAEGTRGTQQPPAVKNEH
ncbi:hypothetical protein SEPCBS119000_001242 [Sporothrix epigloea]|uniref:Uncharacterized protein n=1 Tax=Sporothrix epigloea TaxID=1892477 RepID=A0ABP0DBA7_9PEZI